MEEVIEFAKKKHAGQTRKFTNEPYIEHPLRVAEILKNYNVENDLLIVACLHDTIEDTDATYDEIKEQFGKKIADFVKELTKDQNEIDKIGKTEHLIKKINLMSKNALTVKLADRLDNVNGLPKTDQEFIKKYATQTKKIINNLKQPLDSTQRELFNLIKKKVEELLG